MTNIYRNPFLVKVKQSLYKLGLTLRATGVWGTQNLKTVGIWREQGCQPYAPAAFTPRRWPWYSFLLEADKIPGPYRQKGKSPIGNWTSNLPILSASPQPTPPPRTHHILYLLTPWCRVLLEKLTGLQLVKKFPSFHGTRRFITALTSVRQLALSWASPIQSTYPHPTSWRSILILSTHLRLGLLSGLFLFPTKTLYTPLSLPISSTCPAHLILLDFITRTILGEMYKSFSSSMQSPPFPRYLVPPRSKYSPQHHVLKHPQLPFLPQCQRPGFTPIQNNRQNYSSIYPDL